jgi:hypothetical protein
MDVDLVTLRLRGTFIDFSPQMKPVCGKIRSTSLPACTHQASKSGDAHQYLVNLIAQTQNLPDVYLSRDNERCIDKGSKDDLSTESPPMTARSLLGSKSGTSSLDSENEASASHGLPIEGCIGDMESVVPITTHMICDIPCRTSEFEIVEMLVQLGFGGTYDFLYVPAKQRGRGHRGCLGYAFVNFKSPEVASRFAAVFVNYSFPGSGGSKKLGYVKPAAVQGYEANINMRNSNKWFQKQQRAISEGAR